MEKTQNKVLDAFFKSYSDTEEQLEYHIASHNETILDVIPTGSYLLDEALGSQGYPRGRLIQIYGSPGSGKSLLSMLAIKEAQKLDSESNQIFIDAENTFNVQWAQTLGLDTDRIIVIDGDLAVNGRRCFSLLLGEMKEDAKTHILVGKKKEGLLDKIAKKELNINLIVLDSLGGIIPPGEDTSNVGKANMALLARFLTTTFRKLALEVKKANVAFLIINHKRATLDPYGADHTFSGGNTYTHFLSVNIYLDMVGRKDAMILDEKEQKIGHTLRATTEKSKFAPWPRKCEFKVNFSSGIIDSHEEIAHLAIDYDVVVRPNAMSYEYGETKWVGIAKFHEALKNDSILSKELLDKIVERRKLKASGQTSEALTASSAEDNSDLESVLKPKTKKIKTNEISPKA